LFLILLILAEATKNVRSFSNIFIDKSLLKSTVNEKDCDENVYEES